MNKALAIHVVTEVVILVSCMVFVVKKFKTQQDQIKELKDTLDKQESLISKCMSHIKQLYSIIESNYEPSLPPPSSHPSLHSSLQGSNKMNKEGYRQQVRQPSSTNQHYPTELFIPQMQQMSQMPHIQTMFAVETNLRPQDQMRKESAEKRGPTIIDNFMSVLPAVMSLGAKNDASMILTELEKPVEPKQKMNVEICDDIADDPDIDEALNDDEESIDTPNNSNSEEKNEE